MITTKKEGMKRSLVKSVWRKAGAAAALTALMIMSPVIAVQSALAMDGAECVEYGFKDGKYDACNKWFMASHQFGPGAASSEADQCQQDYDKGYKLGFTEGKLACAPRPPAVVTVPEPVVIDPCPVEVVGGGGGIIGGGTSITNEFVNNGNINAGGQQNVNNGGNQNVNNGGIQNNGTQTVVNNGVPGGFIIPAGANGGAGNTNLGGNQNVNNGGNQNVNNGGVQSNGSQTVVNNPAPGGLVPVMIKADLSKLEVAKSGTAGLANKADAAKKDGIAGSQMSSSLIKADLSKLEVAKNGTAGLGNKISALDVKKDGTSAGKVTPSLLKADLSKLGIAKSGTANLGSKADAIKKDGTSAGKVTQSLLKADLSKLKIGNTGLASKAATSQNKLGLAKQTIPMKLTKTSGSMQNLKKSSASHQIFKPSFSKSTPRIMPAFNHNTSSTRHTMGQFRSTGIQHRR